MEKVANLLSKTLLIILGFILLWTILMGILDYDKIIYLFNPILLIVGIILYVAVLVLFYNKVLPKIENNKILPYILLRNFYYTLFSDFSNIKGKTELGYGSRIQDRCKICHWRKNRYKLFV